MKLLQVPTANLEQRIEEELETNPALEEGNNELEQQEPEPTENTTEEAYELEEYIQDYIDDDPYCYKLRLERGCVE